MKKRILMAICLLVAFVACVHNGKQNSETDKIQYRRISAEEAKKMLDENSNTLLLDVRTRAEFLRGHIPGAISLPSNELRSRAETELPDKDALILVYCGSGKRSVNAALILISMGYTNVYDFGGIMAWKYGTTR